MLLLEGIATSEANNSTFTRDPFTFLYDKLPAGGHMVTVCYLMDGSDYVGSYGPKTRKNFTPETDAILRRELPSVKSDELKSILVDMISGQKYADVINANAGNPEKRKTMPLDLGTGKFCLIEKFQFNWITRPTYAKRFNNSRNGEMKIDQIMATREKFGFGELDSQYSEDDWRRKKEHNGLLLYPDTTGSSYAGDVYTNNHGGSGIYTRPYEQVQTLRKCDLPYVVDGVELIDADGNLSFGGKVKLGVDKVKNKETGETTIKITEKSPVLVSMDEYNKIASLWSPVDAKRFGSAEDPNRMYQIPVVTDARFNSTGEFDNNAIIRQSYDRENRGRNVLCKKWFYIESTGKFVEVSKSLVDALAAKGDRAANAKEAISKEEQDFISEIKQIEEGEFGQEQFSIDKLLYMNCDKFQYLGDKAVSKALNVPAENIQEVIQATNYDPDFDFEEKLDAQRREEYARSLGYDTELPSDTELDESENDYFRENIINIFLCVQDLIKQGLRMKIFNRIDIWRIGSQTDQVQNIIWNMTPSDYIREYSIRPICIMGYDEDVWNNICNRTVKVENAKDNRRMIESVDGNIQDEKTCCLFFPDHITISIKNLASRDSNAIRNFLNILEEMIMGKTKNESAIIESTVKDFLKQLNS